MLNFTTRTAAPIWHEGPDITERGSAEAFRRKVAGKSTQYSETLGRLVDMIIGPNPGKLQEESRNIAAAMKSYKESGGVIPARYNTREDLGLMRSRYSGNFESMMQGYLARNRAKSEAPTVFDMETSSGNLL